MDRLYLTADRYQGPISAAVYIRDHDQDLQVILKAIRYHASVLIFT